MLALGLRGPDRLPAGVAEEDLGEFFKVLDEAIEIWRVTAGASEVRLGGASEPFLHERGSPAAILPLGKVPAPLLADPLGVHINTVTRWAELGPPPDQSPLARPRRR